MTAHPLKAYRDNLEPKMSQTRLAGDLGVSRMTLHRWETGSRQIPLDKIAAISKRTGIPARALRPDLTEMFGSAA